MSHTIDRRGFLRAATAVGAAAVIPGWAQKAHASGVVRVGMTSALTGPAKALGLGMKAGLEGHFKAINAAGGVHGRMIELIAMDDGYEPARAAQNMRTLIDKKGVFAVLGNAGTPTAAVTVPIANAKKTPLFGAFTGAGLLRKSPADRYILNYRASYAQETEAMVHGVVRDLGIRPSQIGFFTQNDAYGDSGYGGGIAALKAMGYKEAERLPHGRYARNTLNVEDGLSRLMDPREDVRAVIMVGAYGPCGQFIRLARKHRFTPICMNVSFVGSRALAGALGGQGSNVVVTQVVPHPTLNVPPAVLFRKEVVAADQSFISFEGHLVARAFVQGLEKAGPGADKERWIDAMESGAAVNLGLGTEKALGKNQHQISHTVWPTVLRDGGFQAMRGWRDLRSRG